MLFFQYAPKKQAPASLGLVFLAADDAAIIFCDDDGGRAWPEPLAITRVGGPLAAVQTRVVDVGLFGALAWVLDVDEQGAPIGGFTKARDFAIFGTHQKAFECHVAWFFAHKSGDGGGTAVGASVRQSDALAVTDLAGDGGQHHAIAAVGVGAVIGLDPAQTGVFAERQTVGAGKILVFG